jgi:DNA-binding beta-propeller fold protein YncE
MEDVMRLSRRFTALTALVITALAVAAAPAGAASDSAPGSTLWTAHYNQPYVGSQNQAAVEAVSPDGSTVFVAGDSAFARHAGNTWYALVAYSTANGHELWAATHREAQKGTSYIHGVAVSPDGSTVFVTGVTSVGYVTIAYDAATGAQLWLASYANPADPAAGGSASAIHVSPDGSTVFVTGVSSAPSGDSGIATVAYNAATGAVLWTARYDNPRMGSGGDALSVSPGGSAVYVAGVVGNGAAIFAYDAGTGALLWSRIRRGQPEFSDVDAMAVSPDGTKVFVTGSGSGGSPKPTDYFTQAYDAATGATAWSRLYRGPRSDDDAATGIAVSPDGSAVFVTGQIHAPTSGYRYATVAYSTSTGVTLWSAVNVNRGLGAVGLAVSPTAPTVYVTGTGFSPHSASNSDLETLAYNATTGAVRWLRRFLCSGEVCEGQAIAVSPDGSKVFTAGNGSERSDASHFGFITVAYNG